MTKKQEYPREVIEGILLARLGNEEVKCSLLLNEEDLQLIIEALRLMSNGLERDSMLEDLKELQREVFGDGH